MKAVYTAVALWGLSLGAMAGPNINVGLVYDYLDSDKRTYLKRVFNGGTSTAFVRVQVMEMRLKTDGTFEETPLKTQANHSTRDGLMASPARLIVPANGTQGTRLLFMGERDTERYFRVRFIPVVPEKEDEFAQSEEDSDAYKKTLSAGINVLAGYGTVFLYGPGRRASIPELRTRVIATPCAMTATPWWWSTNSRTVQAMRHWTVNPLPRPTYYRARHTVLTSSLAGCIA